MKNYSHPECDSVNIFRLAYLGVHKHVKHTQKIEEMREAPISLQSV